MFLYFFSPFSFLHHGNSVSSLEPTCSCIVVESKKSISTALSRWLVKSPAAWTVEIHSLKSNTKQRSEILMRISHHHTMMRNAFEPLRGHRRIDDHSHSHQPNEDSRLINSIFSYLFFADNLRYCDVPSAGSCCTTQMEMKASQFARQVMEKNTRDAIQKMSSTLSTRATKFHGESMSRKNILIYDIFVISMSTKFVIFD